MGEEWEWGINQKVYENKWKWTHNNPKPIGHSKGSPEREAHSDTGISKKDRNTSNKQHNPTFRRTRETTINKAQSE